jgi:predicted MFS family arabinose efflux permease
MAARRPTVPLRWQVILFMIIRWAVNINTRMVYPFLAVFARGLGVDITTISFALTARSLTGVASPLLGPIGDRYGRKVSMLLGMATFGIAMALVIIWPTYPVFFLSVVVGFLGMYIYLPAVQAYLGDAIAYHERGQAMAITELGWSLSFILGIPLVGFLISRYGWQAPFPMLACAGLLAVGLIAWLIPPIQSTAQTGSTSALRNIRSALTQPSVLAAMLLSLAFTCANEVINVMFGVWMSDSFGLKVAALGVASAIIGFSELGAESLSAGLVDRLGKERSIAIGLSLNALAALGLPWLGRSLPGAEVGLGLFFLTFEFAIVCSLSFMTEVLPSARATLMGMNLAAFALGRAIGDLLGPQLYHFGFWANALVAVFFNLVALAALSRIKLKKADLGG